MIGMERKDPFAAILLLILLLRGIDKSSADEDYLEKCCGLGESWASQQLRCESFTGPVSGVAEDEQAACLETVDICCRKAFQERGCEQGKADAKAGLSCTRADTGPRRAPIGLGDYRRDCCEGCKLGMLTGSSGKSCAFKKFSLGIPWDPAFMECCNEALTSTTRDTSSTSEITSPSTSSTTEASSDSDEFDEFTDLDSTTFKSDDLCQLMRGLLCSEICVPTPGSYYCKCHEGSTLQEDGRTCKSNVSTTQATSSTSSFETLTNLTTFSTSFLPSTWTKSIKTPAASETPKSTSITDSTKTTVKSSTVYEKLVAPLAVTKDLLTTAAAKSRSTRSASTEDNDPSSSCPSGYRYSSATITCEDIDECTEGTHNCGDKKCYNLPGRFQCAQPVVPVLKRKTTTNAAVRSTPGSENCSVGSRYDPVRGGCVDVNECEELEDACSSNEECLNTPGSFQCNCLSGFRRDELTQACVDINECQLENDCLASQRCDNTIGGYTCVRFLPCGTGYTLNAATEICEDDDECLLGTHDCANGYHCKNTIGSYRCIKDRKKNFSTTSVRPTTRRTTWPPSTTPYTTPRVTTPKFTTNKPSTTPTSTTTSTTTVKPTTTRSTTTSTPRRRITTTIKPTTTQRRTTPYTTQRTTVTSTTEEIPTVAALITTTQKPKTTITVRPKVICPRGYETGPVGQCIDIDECHRNVNMCGNLRCINTFGSFRCEPRLTCSNGLVPDPATGICTDVDECALGTHKCGPKQKCENRQGGYVCYCPLGYKLSDDHDCVDVNECEQVPPGLSICGSNGRCVNSPGSYQCVCKPGFQKDAAGISCEDINECTVNTGICQQQCHNTWGSYKCSCDYGFRLKPDNRTCQDIDECTEFKENNLCIGFCDNVPGSYVCRCPEGYRLGEDARTCQDIDECADVNVCKTGELCQNIKGGYRCNKINCPAGYIKDPQRKNRCMRESPYCPVNDKACFQLPAHYTFNYIAIISRYPIPVSTGQVELFTMRGAYNLPGSTVRFNIGFVRAQAPPHVQPATESCFALRRPFPSQAILVMTRSLYGPQDIELEFSMEIYKPTGEFAGSAVAKIFIVVTQYEF